MAGYEIVGTTIAFVGIILLYGRLVYYDFIVKNEKQIKKQVEKELTGLMKYHKPFLKEYTPAAFVEILNNITHFEDVVDEAKGNFEKNLIFGGLGVVAASFVYVLYQGTEISTTMGTLGVLGAAYLVYQLNQLRIYKNHIDRYLSGESPEDILEEGEG